MRKAILWPSLETAFFCVAIYVHAYVPGKKPKNERGHVSIYEFKYDSDKSLSTKIKKYWEVEHYHFPTEEHAALSFLVLSPWLNILNPVHESATFQISFPLHSIFSYSTYLLFPP